MKKSSTIVLVLILLAGLSLLLYPTFSNYWNSSRQSRAIASYISDTSNIDKELYKEVLESAKQYNEKYKRDALCALGDEERKEYNDQLDIAGNGMMGYIDIPVINCTLPIYHGTSDSVLQVGAGHLEGSSLPVGGADTHCVIAGHRGLPSAKLFTDLDQLKEGDIFTLNVLDEVFTYEVDQIRIVDPEDITLMTIEEGKELCTLVTCTPYGVNSHRLLIRGHRIANIESSDVRVSADAMQLDDLFVAIAVGVFLLLVLVAILFIRYRRRR